MEKQKAYLIARPFMDWKLTKNRKHPFRSSVDKYPFLQSWRRHYCFMVNNEGILKIVSAVEQFLKTL